MPSQLKVPTVLLGLLSLAGPLAAQQPGIRTFRPAVPPNVIYQQPMYRMQAPQQQPFLPQQTYAAQRQQCQGHRPGQGSGPSPLERELANIRGMTPDLVREQWKELF